MAIYEEYIYVGDNFADIEEEANAGCIYVYDKQGELVNTILSPEPDGGENFAEVIVVKAENYGQSACLGESFVRDVTSHAR